MIPFRFRLDKVLAWRQRQLELAEADFRRESGMLAQLDRASAELEASGIRAEVEVRDRRTVDGCDLAALSGFREHLARRSKQLAAQRAEQAGKLAQSERALMEANRRCRLLERLRDRRLAEWKAADAAELERAASESYLARMARQSTIMDE